MSDLVQVRPLARALLMHALQVLPLLPSDPREESLRAIAGFLASPGASTFLCASRTLQAARRSQALGRLRATTGVNLFQSGLRALEGVAGMEHWIQSLRALPADAVTGRRMTELAQLLAVHEELASRAAASAREIRQRLARPPTGQAVALRLRRRAQGD
ncbi:MAG: hypothetical protein HY698_19180 [Deltaproteobacteria bacterium]|nr:hypothetical protein [Deltaproteobacteria bacterium]